VPPFSLRQITAFGLDPKEYRVIVAKGVNAPLAAYQPVCPSFVRVNTPGVTTADMTQLAFQHRRRPMWPFERETIRSV
jgi:microcystin degradation protein MlrC